jgi:leucyl-tRNA synthetase
MPAYHPKRIEPKWQRYWDEHKTFRTEDAPPAGNKGKLYVLDMFPYPSGSGLHVGHPEGYTATDIYCRAKRMQGYHVLHPMGWDAFGLPAEQYAVQTNTHPRVTTQRNIETFRRQIKALGFSYDWDREVDTTDPGYVKWTQWIFLLIHDTWYDPDFEWTDARGRRRRGKGRPIAELPIPPGTEDAEAYRDRRRLAYRAEVPVNWCPALGTVLANEEVKDGKSERGGHPVVRMPLTQWMLRITAYGERLVEDLEGVDWSPAIKDMQRNWVGRSEGAEVDFKVKRGGDYDNWRVKRQGAGFPEAVESDMIRVFTTRPDTLFGATYMVLAPEHSLVDSITTPEQRARVDAYREQAARKSDFDRTDLAKAKTGVFTGGYAVNPVNGEPVPVWIADYVLIGYGTGAIMAVPGHDERDFAFATEFGLPIRRVVAVSAEEAAVSLTAAEPEPGISVNSRNSEISLDGKPTEEAKRAITAWLSEQGLGRKTVNTKLRDWLFSRQRYWGEPFPVVLDERNRAVALGVEKLPVLLPELEDFRPTGKPEPPLSKAVDWVRYSESYRRETNTMPQWAGSCWYYLRYVDAKNSQCAWDPAKERYWMPVDLYIGGAEHAVLHLLYARFWHKVLFDRGYVSTEEPFARLVNQGMILGEMEFYVASVGTDGVLVETRVPAEEIDLSGKRPIWVKDPAAEVTTMSHKMSKSRGNVINPDEVIDDYGADALRLYEMFMGPLEATKPWSMKGVEGVYRFLGRAWRMIVDFEADELRLDPRVRESPPTPEQAKMIARTVAAVTEDLDALRFNTAISRLMEFVNFFTGEEVRPRSAMETFTLLLAPFAPHLGEELWQMLGHGGTLAYEPWPTYDPKLLVDETIEVPVQVNGKLRSRVTVGAGAGREELERVARQDPKVAALLEGRTIVKVVVVPGKLVNFVVAGG